MRVISQDMYGNKYSIDYSTTVFRLSANMIYARMQDFGDIPIGKYKTNERAAEVFEKMNCLYNGIPFDPYYELPEE